MTDTLTVYLRPDSIAIKTNPSLRIRDNRKLPGQFLMVHQVRKSKSYSSLDSTFSQKVKTGFVKQVFTYIPVDQYLLSERPLAEELNHMLTEDSISFEGTLSIDHLDIWYDKSPLIHKGWVLNGYTRLLDDNGEALKGWQWEIRQKKNKKEELGPFTVRLIHNWKEKQATLLNPGKMFQPSPLPYKRAMIVRLDRVFFPDGYIIDWRVELDYPADQSKQYYRGLSSFGFMYQKNSRHQSILFGKGEQIFRRIHPNFLGRLSYGYRIGTNNFNANYFEQVKLEDILLLKLVVGANIEYRPMYYSGLFVGLGLHQSINIWPEIINRFETGVMVNVGLVLR